MTSRKWNSAKWGSVLVAAVGGLAGVLVAMGYDAEIILKISGTVSAVIAGLFGLNIAAIAHEDAAAKKNPATPAITDAVQRATDELRRSNEQKAEELRQTLLDRAEALVAEAAERIQKQVRR